MSPMDLKTAFEEEFFLLGEFLYVMKKVFGLKVCQLLKFLNGNVEIAYYMQRITMFVCLFERWHREIRCLTILCTVP